MKKFIASLITCGALIQSAYAATPPLTQSLFEYEAIISAIGSNPEFSGIIPPIEFIVDIQRKTEEVNNLGKVKYRISTRVPGDTCEDRKYIATLLVEPNPGVGPKIVNVLKIVPVNHAL
jgi:hypothetical protein